MIYEPVEPLTPKDLEARLATGRPGAPSFPHDLSAMTAESWGIGWVPWLWRVRIRILFVIDGRIMTGHGADDFGLGQVLDTLRDRWFAWWVRFSVRVVDRDPPESFRFTGEGFNLDEFDQVWFFGDWPAFDANSPDVSDDIIRSEEYSPLDDAELQIIAGWMERGGGVFATGDHSLLGASMCSRIPRVRNMRRWTRAQGVPSFADGDRNETLVHDLQTGIIEREGDRWGQQISPVYRSTGPTFYQRSPHPLLCGRTGVIDRFPDHMHEGSVIEDDHVPLRQPLNIPGYDGEEFPVIPAVFEGASALVAEPFGVRPRPHVIAHGHTTTRDSDSRRFAVVGVYDGDPVHVGRVVVDSTWHHWLSMNLVGFQAELPTVYAGMQDYYRNVALWLSTPKQRASMLFAATWGVLVGKHPGAFDRAMGIWDLGERVIDVIGRTAPQCTVTELVATFFRPRTSPGPNSPVNHASVPNRRPERLRPAVSMVNQAIVGGIAFQLLETAQHHLRERALGRSTEVDVPGILRRGPGGVRSGVRELVTTLSESAARFATLGDDLRDPYPQDIELSKSAPESNNDK